MLKFFTNTSDFKEAGWNENSFLLLRNSKNREIEITARIISMSFKDESATVNAEAKLNKPEKNLIHHFRFSKLILESILNGKLWKYFH